MLYIVVNFFFLIMPLLSSSSFFFLNDTAPPEISPLPLHAALPISASARAPATVRRSGRLWAARAALARSPASAALRGTACPPVGGAVRPAAEILEDRAEEIGRAHV